MSATSERGVIRPRVISDVHVRYATFHRATEVAQIPDGTIGLKQQEGGRTYIDLLDKEIAIYSASYPGDPVSHRLAAILSVDDAQSLAKALMITLMGDYQIGAPHIPLPNRLVSIEGVLYFSHNPDVYPKAVVIQNPSVEVRSVALEDLQWPFPRGCEGRQFPIVIASSLDRGEKIPFLLLDHIEAKRVIFGVDLLTNPRSAGKMPYMGKSAVRIWQRIHPERLVTFGQPIPSDVVIDSWLASNL